MRCFKSIRYLCVIALLGGVFWTPRAGAATDEFTQYETDLLDKINEARRNPAQAAADVEDVVITKSLNDALCELQASGLLTTTASNHTLEMADQHYYSYTSLDGRSPEARILDIGYNAALTGEMLGLVTFRNYMPPDTAVNILFKQLLKRDLQQFEAGGDTYIFNPDITEIGIALTAGRVEIGNGVYNGYILTCDFGKPVDRQDSIQDMEFIFLDLLNRVRTAPAETLTEIGYDVAGLVVERPELETFLNSGMAPVTYAPSFREIAFDRNQAVFETLFNFTGADGIILPPSEDHCTESYSDCFAVSGELFAGYQDRGELTKEEVVELIFKELVNRDLISEDPSEMTLMNPETSEISVVFGHRQINSDGKLIQRYVLANAYGNGYLSLIEAQSLNLLNQARAAITKSTVLPENPTDSESATGSTDLVIPDTEAQTAIAEPLPPLITNHLIYGSADQHALEMIEYTNFSNYSHDGTMDLGDRLELAGYQALEYYEDIDIVLEEVQFDIEIAGASMFDKFLVHLDREYVINMNGIDPGVGTGPDSVLEPGMKAAGIRFLYSVPVTNADYPEWDPSGFQKLYSLLIVVDVAEPAVESTEGVLVVLVFDDNNLDGRYDRGEELSSAPVDIYHDNNQAWYRFYTDSSGCLTLPLNTGAYELMVRAEDESLIMTVDMGNENMLVTFPVQPFLESSVDDEAVASVNDFFPAGVDETIVDID